MSNHFQTTGFTTDRVRKVLRVVEFADHQGLDDKQKRDLLKLFGEFATLQELLTNCRLPGKVR